MRDRANVRWVVVGVLLCAFGLCAMTMSAGKAAEQADHAVDPVAYKEFMAATVADIYELEAYFTEQQSSYLPIMPPDPDLVLHQFGCPPVLPFDWKGFPSEFNESLVFEYENSVPVYSISIEEDPITRATVFLNADGKTLFTLPPAKDYDPFAYLKASFPALYGGWYSSERIASWQRLYDPARIRIEVKLIPTEYVEPYLYVAERIQEAQSMASAASSDGGGFLLLRSGEAESNIVFEAFKRTNTGNRVVVGYPDGFTDRLDIFTCNDPLQYLWTFAVKGLTTSGANELVWVDTNYWVFSGPSLRFYSAGNADVDGDGDGYSDASETMVYQTNPADSNSRPVLVAGSVSYTGIETGAIHVLAARSAQSWSIAGAASMAGPGAWSNVVAINQSYWFRAFRDVNTNYTRETWEPRGAYGGGSALVTGDTAGINITLQDQPSIWGTLSYTGSINGDIWVLAVTEPGSWDATYSDVIPWAQEGLTGEVTYTTFPVEYSITDLPASNYWIRAFVDSNTNDAMDWPELAGQYSANAMAVSNRRTGIDFELRYPPTVSGDVSYMTYSGGQAGLIYVVAVASSNSCATNYSAVLDAPGAYQLDNLPLGSNYWIWAWRDSDGNHACDTNEARGYFTNTAILVTGQLVNVNITMIDPDTDGDGLGDWWESIYWDDLAFGLPQSDDDGDKLMNLYEYYAGTNPRDPSVVDTDGDGMSDDWEKHYGLDRFNPSDAHLDTDQDGWTNLEEYNAGTDPTKAYSHPDNCLYVATNGVDDVGHGNFYTNPLLSIGYAFTQASNNQRIILLPGTYSGYSNRVLSLSKSLMLTGVKECREATIVDLRQGGNFLNLAATTTNVIRYLTIRGGRGTSALYNSGATVSLLSCTFLSNWSTYYGGAVYVGQAASLTAEDCLFEANRGSHPINSRGGALAAYSSNTLLIRCRFINNNAPKGGAIDCSTNMVFNNCLIQGNVADSYGGGVYCSASGWGGPSVRFENCTIVDNTASNGGALCIAGPSGEMPARFTNCIVWGNSTDAIVGTNWRAAYSCIQLSSLPPGTGNMTNDPHLQLNRWHLSWYSPCRNKGTNMPGMVDDTDLDGDRRLIDGRVDIGADEYVPRTQFMHMPSYDQSNRWGITVAGMTTRVWVAAYEPTTNQWPFSCWFDHGDGHISKTLTVTRTSSPLHYIGTNHVYSTASLYSVTAYLRDNPGVTITQVFQLSCRETDDYEAHIYHGIEDGLAWLFRNSLYGPNGYCWLYEYGLTQYVASASGMALAAFASHGHHVTLTSAVYAIVIKEGLQYLLAGHLQTNSISTAQCPYYDPDTNTNGIGIVIRSNRYIGAKTMYEIGPVMAAIVKAGDPYTAAPEWTEQGIARRMLKDIIQDIADFCGWAQSTNRLGRGGWRYVQNDTDGADNSVSFWPAMGLYWAEQWGVVMTNNYATNNLKKELDRWVNYSQTTNGGFLYSTDSLKDIRATSTAGGLALMAYTQRPLTDPGVQAARSYLAKTFEYNTNDTYGVFTLAIAATMFTNQLNSIGTQCWRYACAEKLLPAQNADGSWGGCYNDGGTKQIGRVFGTAAAVSILAEATPWRILVTQWARTPASTVTPTDTVSFRAVTLPRPEATNLTLTTWYRASPATHFTALAMTNQAAVFTTASPLPAMPAGTTCEYHLVATYWRDGLAYTNRYPSACEEDYEAFIVSP